MRKNYETVTLEIEYFETSDVIMASVPVGGNNDGTVNDIYGDLL